VSQEDQPREAGDPHRQCWPWLLAGALLGIIFGSLFGAAIGLATEGFLVLLVNRLPDEKVRTVYGAVLLIGFGVLVGAGSAAVLANYMKLKQEMPMVAIFGKGDELSGIADWVICGGVIGGLIAAIDRLFMWVVFPYGVEPPEESSDSPVQEFERED
jgi:hypothetical protein